MDKIKLKELIDRCAEGGGEQAMKDLEAFHIPARHDVYDWLMEQSAMWYSELLNAIDDGDLQSCGPIHWRAEYYSMVAETISPWIPLDKDQDNLPF